MSGIYGVMDRSWTKQDYKQSLDNMEKWNLSYGKEQKEQYISEMIGFGICTEHITNAPKNENPILQRDGVIAVIDAILYNRSTLLDKYGLSMLLSDEELLFTCILEHGYEALAGCNGDFCGAVWDTAKNTLTLFRDHCGIRPLFFCKQKACTGFSSDLRGLLSMPQLPGEIEPLFLYKMLSGYDTADFTKTEVKDVYQVRPGGYVTITWENEYMTFHEAFYWKLGSKKIKLSSRQAYTDRLREMITASVNKRLDVFDGKIGGELSGGLDSGVIDILINRHKREGAFYSWSFSPKDLPLVEDDERQVIADICRQENIHCHYGAMSMNLGKDAPIGKNHGNIGLCFDIDRKPEINYALPLYINTLIICETAEYVARMGCRVVFTGHGGDEGVSHRADPFEMFQYREYWHFYKYLWEQNAGKKFRFLRTMKLFYKRFQRRKFFRTDPLVIEERAPELLKKEFKEQYLHMPMPVLTFAFDPIQYFYSGNTHNRPDVTALLGAYSDVRYIFPYLDYEVIDYAMSIPRYLYLNGSQKRYIFRQAFKDLMPDSLYRCTAKNNPSTLNYHQEDTEWFEHYAPYKDYLYQSLDRDFWADYLDFDQIDNWYKAPKPSDQDKMQFANIALKLEQCMQYQNMIKTVKGKL